MKPEIQVALVGAAMKWDGIAQGYNIDRGSNNCPLCILIEHCLGDQPHHPCPIAVDTGKIDCIGTQYHKIKHLTTYGYQLPEDVHDTVRGEICDLIEEFIEYLISLLPEEHELRGEI